MDTYDGLATPRLTIGHSVFFASSAQERSDPSRFSMFFLRALPGQQPWNHEEETEHNAGERTKVVAHGSLVVPSEHRALTHGIPAEGGSYCSKTERSDKTSSKMLSSRNAVDS